MELILRMGRWYLNHYVGLSSQAWRGITLSLIESTLMGILYFLSLYFVNELHFTAATAGAVISFYGIGAIAGGFISGKACDKFSPSKITICSLGIQAFCYLVLYASVNQSVLTINMLILGFASYAFITANQLWVLTQDTYDHHKLKTINLLSTASNLGLAFSAMLISLLYHQGFKFIFGLSGMLLTVLTFYLIRHSNITNQLPSIKITRDEPSFTKSNTLIMVYILSGVFFIGLIVAQLGTTYPLYISTQFPTMGIKFIGVLFTLNSLIVVFFETPLGNILSEYNKTVLVGIGSFLIGTGMLMLTVSTNFLYLSFACVVYTLGEIIFFCMAQFLCYQNSNQNKKGSALGTFRMTYACSRIAGPIAGGYIYHRFGGDMVWYISGIIGFSYLLLGKSIARLYK